MKEFEAVQSSGMVRRDNFASPFSMRRHEMVQPEVDHAPVERFVGVVEILRIWHMSSNGQCLVAAGHTWESAARERFGVESTGTTAKPESVRASDPSSSSPRTTLA